LIDVVITGMPDSANVPQLLEALVPLAVNFPPVTPEVPVQVSLPVNVKVAEVATPENMRPGWTTNLPFDTEHPSVPDAFTAPFAPCTPA
jgi:hypothetical protein